MVGLVDDDPSVREALGSLVRSSGLRFEAFASASEFLARRDAEMPACLIVDLNLPGRSGLDLQDELGRAGSPSQVIFLTGHGDIPTSVRAIKAGALDFFTKPCSGEDLLAAIREGIARSLAIRRRSAPPLPGNLVGDGPAARAVMQQITLVAATDATVLVTGESGTGKELVARAIHERSARRERPLVRVNCAAVPEALFESEFFGSVKGAFTGAIRDRPGRFELAEGGTLFLDEISEVPLALQAKLLRVLQEKEVERIGESRLRKLSVRIVAATNRDLRAEVASGRFRRDLFYRLSVFPLELPPLRARREDIAPLARHFVAAVTRGLGAIPLRLTDAELRRLESYDWPGNIRELQNSVERAVILAEDGELRFDFLGAPGPVAAAPGAAGRGDDPLLTRDGLRVRERESIVLALTRAGGKIAGPHGAAALLGMRPTTLHSRLRALGLSRDRCEPAAKKGER